MPLEFNQISVFEKISKRNGNYLVTGGAGTGKSRFLIQLIKYFITEKKVDSSKILVFTFNRKISKFYREEISRSLEKTLLEIPIMTFYSFCLDFINKIRIDDSFEKDDFNCLKNHSYENKIKFHDYFDKITSEINLLNAPRQWDLIISILNDLNKDDYFQTVKLLKSNDFTKASVTQEIFDYILRAQENALDPEHLASKFTPYVNQLMYEINNIYFQYKKKMQENDFYDYGRILKDTADILKNEKTVSNFYKQEYEFIIVDDCQELNFACTEIIQNISNGNVIFFGNDDELIYAFRGSNSSSYFDIYKNLSFENIVTLKYNFRNDFVINEILNDFIGRNKIRIKKRSDSVQKNTLNGEVVLSSFHNLHDELNFIICKIHFLHFVKNIKLSDMAIILKGSEYETNIIENFLSQNKVAYYLRNSRSTLGSKYVKQVLNICKLCILVSDYNKSRKSLPVNENPKKEDDPSSSVDEYVKCVLFSELFGMQPLFFKEMEIAYTRSYAQKSYRNIWQYITKNLRSFKKIDIDNYEILKKFIVSISRFSKKINSNSFDFFANLIKDKNIGLFKIIKSYDREDLIEKNLIKTLTDYLESVKSFSKNKFPKNDVKDYINYIDNLRNNQFIEEIEESTKDIRSDEGIRIISFYESKNYDFEAVFIPFLNKGYLPSDFSCPQTYDLKIFQVFKQRKIATEEEAKRNHIEEERRILAMGISRAKNYLYITSNEYKAKSPFFQELNDDLNKCKSLKVDKCKTDMIPDASGSFCKSKDSIVKRICFEYIKNKWLLKKKALVLTNRIENNMYVSKEKYNRYLVSLKKLYGPDSWWNLRKETLNDTNPYEIQKNFFSYSSLESYDKCPLKYKFKYFLKVKGEEEKYSMLIGRVYHEIIRRFFEESKDYKIEDLLKIANDEVDAVKSQFKYDFYIEEFKENSIRDFNNFHIFFVSELIENLTKKPDGKLFFCEKDFVFKLSGDDYITGKIDFINISNRNNMEIIDFKSSSNKYSDKELKEELQLKIYRLAIESCDFPDKENIGLKDMNIVLKYYFISKDKDPFLMMPSDYYKKDELTEKIMKITSGIKNEKFETNPKDYMSCYYCNYKIFCEKYYGNQI
ncbi:MAG: ATP-dependent DNA helicase [Actinomycetota bacterium]|nr:ATP-dependent DNA helicase [Actinomycetota bacterium]